MDSWTKLTEAAQNPVKYSQLFRSLELGCLRALMPWSVLYKACVWIWISFLPKLMLWRFSFLFFEAVPKRLLCGATTACSCEALCLVPQGNGPRRDKHLLRGEVLKPATELAMKKSAICLRASSPVGLFPFRCCSWIRHSNSSLKAFKTKQTWIEQNVCLTLHILIHQSNLAILAGLFLYICLKKWELQGFDIFLMSQFHTFLNLNYNNKNFLCFKSILDIWEQNSSWRAPVL